MEHGCREHGVGARVDRRGEVAHRSRPAGGDHRHRRDLAHEPDELEVEAVLRAVGVDRVDEELARAAVDRLAGPVEGVELRLGATAVRRHDEPGVRAGGAHDVEGEHEHLRAEPVGDLVDESGAGDRGGVHPDLVGPDGEQARDVVGGAHSPAYRERDEDLLRGAPDDVVRRRPGIDRRGDVEERQLVGALREVRRGELDRIAHVAEVREVDPLHDAAGGDVETRDDAARESHVRASRCGWA